MVCHRTRSLPTRLRLRSVHCSMPTGLGSSGYSPAGYSSSSAYGVTHKCCGSWKAGIQDEHDDDGSIFVQGKADTQNEHAQYCVCVLRFQRGLHHMRWFRHPVQSIVGGQ